MIWSPITYPNGGYSSKNFGAKIFSGSDKVSNLKMRKKGHFIKKKWKPLTLKACIFWTIENFGTKTKLKIFPH